MRAVLPAPSTRCPSDWEGCRRLFVFGHGKGVGTVSVIGIPSSGGSNSISARALQAKTNSELERIARDNVHDPAVLGAVHRALKGRTRKRAVRLRTEIREQ